MFTFIVSNPFIQNQTEHAAPDGVRAATLSCPTNMEALLTWNRYKHGAATNIWNPSGFQLSKLRVTTAAVQQKKPNDSANHWVIRLN